MNPPTHYVGIDLGQSRSSAVIVYANGSDSIPPVPGGTGDQVESSVHIVVAAKRLHFQTDAQYRDKSAGLKICGWKQLLSVPFDVERDLADNARVVKGQTPVSAHNRDITLVAIEAKSPAGHVWVCAAIVKVTRWLAPPVSHIAGRS